MSLVLEERRTGIWQSLVTVCYKNCASDSEVPGQPGAKYKNIKLFYLLYLVSYINLVLKDVRLLAMFDKVSQFPQLN